MRREEKRPPRGPAGLWGAPGSRPARARPAARKPARGPPGRGGARGRGAGEGRDPEAEGRNYITNNPGLKL